MKKIIPVLTLIYIILGIIIIDSCKKDVVIPTLTTTTVSTITTTTATSGGVITKDGGATVTARGVCWGTSSNPTISGSHTSDDKGVGSFTSNLTELTPNTQYYVRAYATNKAGTAYGNEVIFTSTTIVVPSLTTTEVTEITLTTAVSGGDITADGYAAVTAKGVCWSTTTGPIATGSHTTEGTGTGSFVSNLTGLLPGTTYYLRAYATNSAGTAYGNEVTFKTTSVVVPTLTTTAATLITLTTAASGGNITADGGGAVTARGVCWAITANPIATGLHTTDGTGIGSFISSLTGLLPGTTYHIRAFATNSAGTGYGSDLTFTTTQIGVPTLTTTTVTSITLTTAVSGGNITADGGGAVTARGVCWATTSGPIATGLHTTDGSGNGSFVSDLTGLLPNTPYYVRAYATNSTGTAYGNEVSFTTSQIVLATLTTTAATSITLTTAVSGGNITNNGGGAVSASGVCWSTTGTPTISNFITTDGTATGSYVSNLTGLIPGTQYHVRAYATNSAGTAYGNEITFTTNAALIPTLTTTAVTSITLTTAVSGGNITADGGASVTARGVCWSTTAGPIATDAHTTDATGTGSFVSNLSGLLPGTPYYLRAYATNIAGTAYGNEITFTTSPVAMPTLTTTAITSIALTTAVSGGNITNDGGAAVTARGICWTLTGTPMVTDHPTTNGTGTGTFISNITGLTAGTSYNVRAYATNSAGTAYGNLIVFNTNIADVDGNTYKTVTIGTQVWMAENLATTKFSDNTGIPNVTTNAAWIALITPAYCWYNNDGTTYKPLYGGLYNWFAVNSGNLCPTGWHVPSDDEFNTLEFTLGLPSDSLVIWGWRGTISQLGNQLKSTTGWAAGENGTNTSGFTALPGGYRYGIDGNFEPLNITYWWTSSAHNATEAWYRRLDGNNIRSYRAAVVYQGGKYVRCLKN